MQERSSLVSAMKVLSWMGLAGGALAGITSIFHTELLAALYWLLAGVGAFVLLQTFAYGVELLEDIRNALTVQVSRSGERKRDEHKQVLDALQRIELRQRADWEDKGA